MILVIEPRAGTLTGLSFNGGPGPERLTIPAVENTSPRAVLSFRKACDAKFRGKKPRAISFRIPFALDKAARPLPVNAGLLDTLHGSVYNQPLLVPLFEAAMRFFRRTYPRLPQFAFFENAFFNELPHEERCYAMAGTDARKRGFHGTYHQGSIQAAPGAKKIISVVFDTHTSVCGILNGKPVHISLGRSPLEGIMGRTSSGDLDPGIVFYLMRQKKLSVFEIDAILKRQSGFLGLSGYDAPIDELYRLYGKSKRVSFSFEVYEGHVTKYIGECIALLEGLDAVAISGACAVPLQPFWYRLLKKLSFLGIHLASPDPGSHNVRISSSQSPIAVYVNKRSAAEIVAKRTAELLPGNASGV